MVVIAFESTHAAMAAQKALEGMAFYVIPTPTDISASCGISLRLEDDLLEDAAARLEAHPDIAEHATWHYR